jgi:hypothetical protein
VYVNGRVWVPKIWVLILEVRPLSTSCLWLKTLTRINPRPLSNCPLVNTPISVLFPLSTFPQTAIRISI